MNEWFMYFFAILGSTEGEFTNLSKISYTRCKWGHAGSKEGSSSSFSPPLLDLEAR